MIKLNIPSSINETDLLFICSLSLKGDFIDIKGISLSKDVLPMDDTVK